MTEDRCQIALKSAVQSKSSEIIGLMERVNRHLPEPIEGLLWHAIPIFLEIMLAFIVVVRLTAPLVALILLSTVILYLASLNNSFKKIIQCNLLAVAGQMRFISKIMDTFSNLDLVQLFDGYETEATQIGQVIRHKEEAMVATHIQVEKLGSMQFLIVRS